MGAAGTIIGPQTLGSLKAMITRYHKEQEDDDLLTDAANDAIEALWRNVLLVALGQFMGATPKTLNIAAGSERATIISISDPIAAPTLGQVAGGALNSRTIVGSYTFVTESGSETLQSGTATFIVGGANLLTSQSPAYPTNGDQPIGWNFYAGIVDVTRMAKQNGEPLAFGQTFQEPADTGIQIAPDSPSPPTVNNTADNIFYIRVLQVENTDGTWTTWQAGEIDGLLMSRATRSIASSSTYQGYAYDVFNGNTIEVRPALGATLSPRYFYVVKPRRIIYNKALLPFSNFSYLEFLKMYADAALDLSNHEYAGYGIKSKKAAGILQEVLQGLNTQATVKQKTITPFMSW